MDNISLIKSYNFALEIIKLHQMLIRRKEFVLSKQILKSGTSIGANIEEAVGGYSGKDFSAKMSIAYKEARETKYWLRLLRDSGLINNQHFEKLIDMCEELIRITASIVKTMKTKISLKLR